jgi:hypothetical protein
MVQAVQKVPVVQTLSLTFPRDAGEERGGDLNSLNVLNDLNAR